MKKILIVIPSLDQGGGQKFVIDLINGLDKKEYIVKLLVYYRKTDSIFDKIVEQENINTVYLNKKVGFDFSFFKKVRSVITDFQPDVIHTHLHSMLYLLPSYNRKQIKLHTVHTLAEKETVGMQGIVRCIAYKVMGVIPVGICDTVADSIAKKHGIRREKIPVVYNGVDCRRYDIPKIASDEIRLVTVGNIYDVKNYSFLINCFAKVCNEVKNVRLTIVGDGVLRSDIERQVSELGIADKVTITGVVSDVENYLANADIYVASSIFEGLPLSMLEAMAAGLPVISTDVGGVHDIIKNGENGILVNFGNTEGYVQALFELITNTQKRIECSKKSKSFSYYYDEKITVEGYEKLYQG